VFDASGMDRSRLSSEPAQAGADAWRSTGEVLNRRSGKSLDSWVADLETLATAFEIGLTSRTAVVPAAFAGYPVVQQPQSFGVLWLEVR